MNIEKRIAAFAREISGGPLQRTTYARFDPDGYFTYVLKPEPRAIRWLAERIAGPGAVRRAGRASLLLSSRIPVLFRFVPFVSRTELRVPSNQFDVGVISGTSITLIEFDREIVWTIPRDESGSLRAALDMRRSLPSDIAVPELLETDEEYPYMAERVVVGRELSDPVDEWPLLEAAFEQLTELYRAPDREFVSMETVRTEMNERLRSRGLRGDRVIERALQLLSSDRLPEGLFRSRIHGDLHVGNVFCTEENEVYLLDWEDSRRDFVVLDFFRPFLIHYYDTKDPAIVREFRSEQGDGGRIADRYADLCGDAAYGSTEWYSGLSGLYLLYVLSAMDREDSLWDACYDLLSALY